MAREGGAAALQAVGVVIVAAGLIVGVLAAVSEGRIGASIAYASCSVTGGSCVDPHVLVGLGTHSEGCAVPPAGPAGATRLAYRVDVGAGEPVNVEESAGGAFTVTRSAGRDSTVGFHGRSWSQDAAAVLYTAGSPAQLGGVLTGLRRQQRQESWFGSGGSVVADAWAGVGAGVFTAAGEPSAPEPSGRYTPTGVGLAPSAHAYELANAMGEAGGAVPTGTARWQGGGTTEAFAGGTATTPLGLEIDRDAASYITQVRTTVPAGRGTRVSALRVDSVAQASQAEGLFRGLGVTSARRYAQAVQSAPEPSTRDVIGAFTEAASRSGYVSRSTADPTAGLPAVVPLDDLAAEMERARVRTPAAEHWDGSSWQAWTPCR